MNLLEKLNISRKILQAIAFRKRLPLIVGWRITERCNLSCKYCGYSEKKHEELNTASIFKIIRELDCLGTKFVSFDGGEPLLREDLPDMINFCRAKKMYVSVNSNGTLVKQKIKEIRGADAIKLSLDGPKHVNDAIRGPGVHDKVIEAIEACKKEKIKVNIVTVISKHNISHIPYILELAENYDIGVYFQPVNRYGSSNSDKDITSEIPDAKDYKRVISFLINEKRKTSKFISNSIAGLRHLYYWPKPKKMFCLASLIFCSIEPNGKIFICDNFPDYRRFSVPTNPELKESFNNLSLPHPCRQCWTASLVELNLLGSLNLNSIAEMRRRLKC